MGSCDSCLRLTRVAATESANYRTGKPVSLYPYIPPPRRVRGLYGGIQKICSRMLDPGGQATGVAEMCSRDSKVAWLLAARIYLSIIRRDDKMHTEIKNCVFYIRTLINLAFYSLDVRKTHEQVHKTII